MVIVDCDMVIEDRCRLLDFQKESFHRYQHGLATAKLALVEWILGNLNSAATACVSDVLSKAVNLMAKAHCPILNSITTCHLSINYQILDLTRHFMDFDACFTT